MDELEPGPLGRIFAGLDADRLVRLHALDRLSGPDRERAVAAAKQLLGVDHPNLEEVLEVDDTGILVEHADGQRLAETPRPSLQEALLIGEQLAGALAAVHAAGLAHRAFDASAVIYLGQGAVKVSKAGLVPPEVPGDATADQRALGRVLFTLIAGVPPGPPLSEACPGVPRDVEDAVDRARAGDFASMSDLEDALRACWARLTGSPLFPKKPRGTFVKNRLPGARRRRWLTRGSAFPILPVPPETLAFALGAAVMIYGLITLSNLGQGVVGGTTTAQHKPPPPPPGPGPGVSLADALVGGATPSAAPPARGPQASSPRPEECELSARHYSEPEIRTYLRCRLAAFFRL